VITRNCGMLAVYAWCGVACGGAAATGAPKDAGSAGEGAVEPPGAEDAGSEEPPACGMFDAGLDGSFESVPLVARPGVCYPMPLPQASGQVACDVIAVLPVDAGGTCLHPNCNIASGLLVPDPTVSSLFCAQQQQSYASVGCAASGLPDPSVLSACVLRQLVSQTAPSDFPNGSCVGSPESGWCYLTDAGGCPQAVGIASSAMASGAVFYLSCPVVSDGGR
jgi:hypothetical protein